MALQAIQGHVFWGQLKGDKGLKICIIMLASFPKVPNT